MMPLALVWGQHDLGAVLVVAVMCPGVVVRMSHILPESAKMPGIRLRH